MYIEIVDDNEKLSSQIQKWFRKRWDSATVYNSRDSFVHGSKFDADLYIMDINLWDGNGLDMIEHMRVVENVSNPIIIISGETRSRVMQEWYTLWADDFIEKPFSMSDLFERIETITSHISARKSISCWCQDKPLYSCLSEQEKNKLFKN